MQLTAFRVFKYRNIGDSGLVNLSDRLTCIVGKNQSGKTNLLKALQKLNPHAPQFFFAQDRSLAESAYAGDVVGIPNHGTLRIGDTLTEGEEILFRGVPNFAPEILRRVRLGDAMTVPANRNVSWLT